MVFENKHSVISIQQSAKAKACDPLPTAQLKREKRLRIEAD